jgi:all-trans-retinol dehydrogenase (NAD+)
VTKKPLTISQLFGWSPFASITTMPNIFSLPREGITLEYLCRPLTATLLQPILTGAALYASIRYPAHTEKVVFGVFGGAVSSSRLIKSLKYLLAFGTIYRLNRWSNRLAVNNFTSDSKWNWEKEIVVVTGGSSGIGALMVQQFAKRNITVIALDIRPPAAGLPSNAKFYKVDVSSFEEIHETAEKIREEVGDPTVLINNAGIALGNTILDESEENIRRVFDVNIISHFGLIKEFLPYMVQRDHGHIVTVASMASFMVNASNIDYACTKVAALALHEGLNLELQHIYKAKRVRTT